MGNSENIPHMTEDRDIYLGHTTGVNIYIGVKYHRNEREDSWWMCVAHRNITAAHPGQNAPANLPAAVIVGELQPVGSRYPKVTIPRGEQWTVPTTLLYHPQPVPILNPPLPVALVINVEDYRLEILASRGI